MSLSTNKRLSKCIIRIEADWPSAEESSRGEISVGTGFFIDSRGRILTSAHIIRSKTRGLAHTITARYDHINYPVSLVFISPDPTNIDYAVLQLQPEALPTGAEFLRLGTWDENKACLDKKILTMGFSSKIFTAVHATGKILGVVSIETSTRNSRSLQIDSRDISQHGMSGAPLYHEPTEQVVGIVEGIVKEYSRETPIGVPLEEIGKVCTDVQELLDEQRLFDTLYDILRLPQFFTEDSLFELYGRLHFIDLPRYNRLPADKPKGMLEQARNRGQLRNFRTVLESYRGDILFKRLLELPFVNFKNRKFEQDRACYSINPLPYIFFDAPSGYGKTELLHALERFHVQEGWFFAYLPISFEIRSALELAKALVEALSFTALLIDPMPGLEEMANDMGMLLRQKVHDSGAPGVAFLIDNAERLPQAEIEPFLNQFVAPLQEKLGSIPFRLRVAGRHVGWKWESYAKKKFSSRVMPLSPFRFRYVKETVQSLLPRQKEVDLYAALLMHATGGHPGCMAEIIHRLGPLDPVEAGFSAHEADIRQIVLRTVREIQEAIPEELWPYFNSLSAFRRYHVSLLSDMQSMGIIPSGIDCCELEEQLLQTYLVDRKNHFIQDNIVRRLLSLRLQWEDPVGFLSLCRAAVQIYQAALATSNEDLEVYTLEAILAELALLYYHGSGTEVERQNLSQEFFAEDGILRRYLKRIRSDPKWWDPSRNLLKLIQSTEDDDGEWEFRFAINFFLRGKNYNNDPYQQLVEIVSRYYERGHIK